jgi:predicted transcriptional regulator
MSESYQSKYDQRNSNNQFIDQAQSGSNPTFNQHNYTPEQKQNLAQAAAEIQQLLNQLAQTNPTTEEVTQAVHQKIKQDPTLKARLLGALEAGLLEALKTTVNHPLFSIPAETIKGWLEAE